MKNPYFIENWIKVKNGQKLKNKVDYSRKWILWMYIYSRILDVYVLESGYSTANEIPDWNRIPD